MNHTLYKCLDCKATPCQFCDGGLQSCTVCNGSESSLTMHCPGRPLSDKEQRETSSEQLDFKDERWVRYGLLTRVLCKKKLPLQVLQSNAGFYLGTLEDSEPYARESIEYFSSEEVAHQALATGSWTQRDHL